MNVPADALPFLTELKSNNHREWFNDNKRRFTDLQAELYEFIEHLIGEMCVVAPEHMGIEAKQCLFRIHKDARFAKGQPPYKTHFGIHIVPSGHRADFERAGFYLRIEPENSMLGGGAHSPSSTWLKSIRHEIFRNGNQLDTVLHAQNFRKWFGELQGEQLKRPPLGFSADSPHLELLKRKALWVQHPVEDEHIRDEHFDRYFIEAFEAYRPFQVYLNDVKAD